MVYWSLQLNVWKLVNIAMFSCYELCHLMVWFKLLARLVLLLFLRLLDLLVHQLNNIVQFVKVQLIIALEWLIILVFDFPLAFFSFDGLSFLKLEKPLFESSNIHSIFFRHGLRASDIMPTFGRWHFNMTIFRQRFVFLVKAFLQIDNI